MSNQISNAPRVAVTGYGGNFGVAPRLLASRFIAIRRLFEVSRDFSGRGCIIEPVERESALSIELRSAGLRVGNEWRIDSECVQICFAASKPDWTPGELRHKWTPEQAFAGRLDFIQKKATWEGLGGCDRFATQIAQQIEVANGSFAPVAACATGAHCIAMGAQTIRWQQMDVVIAGSSEYAQNPLFLAGYKQLGALSKSGVMRPFDKGRDGFVTGVGDAFVILENEDKARQRDAKIYGYVTGYDMGADATSLTGMNPSGASIARAMERALKRAGNPEIDYINAHGTATPLNDAIESRAIKSVFGSSVPVSSTKPLTGHLLGAAGAVEAVICLQALREQWVPPTLNLEEADEECDLDYIPITPNESGRDLPLKAVMSLNYGFGGHIGVLILEKAE